MFQVRDRGPLKDGGRVAIVGGGPGGTGCAIALMQRSRRMGRESELTRDVWYGRLVRTLALLLSKRLSFSTRTNFEGFVAVMLVYAGLSWEGELIFKVTLAAKEADLEGYQLEALSFLRDDKAREFPALRWEPFRSFKGHRLGTLIFPGKDEKGRFILDKGTGYIEVWMRDVGGVKERVFRWEFPR